MGEPIDASQVFAVCTVKEALVEAACGRSLVRQKLLCWARSDDKDLDKRLRFDTDDKAVRDVSLGAASRYIHQLLIPGLRDGMNPDSFQIAPLSAHHKGFECPAMCPVSLTEGEPTVYCQEAATEPGFWDCEVWYEYRCAYAPGQDPPPPREPPSVPGFPQPTEPEAPASPIGVRAVWITYEINPAECVAKTHRFTICVHVKSALGGLEAVARHGLQEAYEKYMLEVATAAFRGLRDLVRCDSPCYVVWKTRPDFPRSDGVVGDKGNIVQCFYWEFRCEPFTGLPAPDTQGKGYYSIGSRSVPRLANTRFLPSYGFDVLPRAPAQANRLRGNNSHLEVLSPPALESTAEGRLGWAPTWDGGVESISALFSVPVTLDGRLTQQWDGGRQ